MSISLTHAGYTYDKETLVWARKDFTGIAYSDGEEVEIRIASIINNTNDLSVLSDELQPHCTDWPTLYHLSGSRANILRPFESKLSGDILEIGAGCGAITRYLGECGGNVLALEGSPRRAAIARARTRDLDNVDVVSDKFDAFRCDKKFDVITLIGVLEYSNIFTTGKHPALSMLERVRAFLRPNGILIIAIENQLGLKYFAGSKEDHLGIPMYGIEGRYRSDQPQTFGRKELSELLNKAGFKSNEFLAPFPDYKLPVSIVTELGFLCDAFDASALLSQSVYRDPQLPKILAFSPELVWPIIVKNELALDLANSFLIVASPNKSESMVSLNTLSWHFTTDRRSELCKLTQFVEVETNRVEVHYKRLDPIASNPILGDVLQHFLPERVEYKRGNVMSKEIIGIVTRDGWCIEDVGHCLGRWLKFIAVLAAKQGALIDISNPLSKVPGIYFDSIPQNVIVSSDQSLHVIDNEWVANENLEIGYLVFRSIWALLHKLKKFGRPKKEEIKTLYDLVTSTMNSLGWFKANKNITRWMEFEYRVQSEVAGRTISPVGVMDWLKNAALPTANLSHAVSELEGKIDTLNQSVSERDNHIAGLSHAAIERVDRIKNDYETEITRIGKERDTLLIEKDKVWSARVDEIINDYETEITRIGKERDTLLIEKDKVWSARVDEIINDYETEITRIGKERDTLLIEKDKVWSARVDEIINDYETEITRIGKERDTLLIEKDKVWSARVDEIINDYETEITRIGKERDTLLIEKDKVWSARVDEIINDYETEITRIGKERDTLLIEKDKVWSARVDEIINDYETEITRIGKERDTLLIEKDKVWSARVDEIINDYETEITRIGKERDTLLIEKDKVWSARVDEIINDYETEITRIGKERDTLLIEKDKVWSARVDEIINDYETEITRIGKERDIELAERDMQIANLINSNSWRLTKPLRFIGRVLRGEFITALSPIKEELIKEFEKRLRQARNLVSLLIRGDFKEIATRIQQRKLFLVFDRKQQIDLTNNVENFKKKCWGIMTTPHTLFIAHLLSKRLKENGFYVVVLTSPPETFHHDVYIVICPQMFDKLPPGEKRVIFQMEQSVSSRWFTDTYLDTLENSLAVLEYSLVNIDFMANKNVAYPHVHYLPVGASTTYGNLTPSLEKNCDVLFYGDSGSSLRRREMLIALSKNFNVRVVNEVFGPEMMAAIKQAKLVVNLHYYDNALLEMPRIQECLSLGVSVVSESAKDQDDYPELVGAVYFFEQGSIPAMLNAVQLALENSVPPENISSSVALSQNRFAFFFDRFLVAMNFLPVSSVRQLNLPFPNSANRVALSLPETIKRRRVFEMERPKDCVVFDGIRRHPGWIGCGLSYVAIAQHALKQGKSRLLVMEDDVVLPHDFELKMDVIHEFLDSNKNKWDVFAGVIASLHADAKILSVEVFNDITFVTINKMTSTVFNIYSEKALRILASWDPENVDAVSNTIDRYLESQTDLRVVVTIPFFVSHREEVHSTLWGFQNTQYMDMITNSERSLENMVLTHQHESTIT